MIIVIAASVVLFGKQESNSFDQPPTQQQQQPQNTNTNSGKTFNF
jgi:hypothetical protein